MRFTRQKIEGQKISSMFIFLNKACYKVERKQPRIKCAQGIRVCGNYFFNVYLAKLQERRMWKRVIIDAQIGELKTSCCYC